MKIQHKLNIKPKNNVRFFKSRKNEIGMQCNRNHMPIAYF